MRTYARGEHPQSGSTNTKPHSRSHWLRGFSPGVLSPPVAYQTPAPTWNTYVSLSMSKNP